MLRDELGPLKTRPRSRWFFFTTIFLLVSVAGWFVTTASIDIHAKYALWTAGSAALQRQRTDTATVTIRDLFGSDVDGICIFYNKHTLTEQQAARLPIAFRHVVTTVPTDDATDSDLRRWVVYSVRNGEVKQKYEFWVENDEIFLVSSRHPSTDPLASTDPVEGCYTGETNVKVWMTRGSDGPEMGVEVPNTGYSAWRYRCP